MKVKSYLLTAACASVMVVLLSLLASSEAPPSGAAAELFASPLAINEIDYDQPALDAAEFIEILNTSGSSVNLDPYSLALVQGSGGGATIYDTIDLPSVDLPSADYYVICGYSGNVANCDLDVTPDTDLIQNGAPDAVALVLGTAIVDTVSYEGDTGAPYTEGSGVGLLDDPAEHSSGLSRCPHGTDTDQNNVDFSFLGITPGAANLCEQCGDPATFIHEIQGSGPSTPIPGATADIEGVVIGDFQDTTTQLSGFFVQEEGADADGDPLTSEGIFVYDDGFGVDVSPGDVVRVRGQVSEYGGLTELGSISSVLACSSGATVTETAIDLPVAATDDLERYEGMLVAVPEVLYATETHNLGSYGEVSLSAGDRLFAPTNVTTPGAPALALQDLNDRSRLLLDDGSHVENPPVVPYLAVDNTLRLGDSVQDLTGVLSYSHDTYRLHPTIPPVFVRANDRTSAPEDPGDTFTVAGMSVLNYFNGDGLGGGFPTPRGADTLSEFNRQRAKIITATLAMEADVIGLVEIENDGYGAGSAIQDLVNGLNDVAGAGTYALIDPGLPQIGTDEIAVAFIYRTATATPVGTAAILDSTVDPTYDSNRNRPALAQAFEAIETGERFTVAVNHLKSKGTACDDVGDPDTGDGQGNCNLTRTYAAVALANWLATDPTGSGDPDSLIIGDLNAYAMEDPVTALKDAGYTDLVRAFEGEGAYSYVLYGQSGSLDHALANARLRPQVVDTAIWHINADEPRVLDYNEHNPAYLYRPDAYRSSDHDAILVHLRPASRIFLPVVLRAHMP